MLVSFSVTNFRSFHARQTFSCIAESDRTYRETNCHSTPFKRAAWIHATDALFGANASGKSNLYLALLAVWYFVTFSSSQQSSMWQPYARYTPFAFSNKPDLQPTEFETCFIKDNKMYWLVFSYLNMRFVSESLHVQENKKKVLLYSRTIDPNNENKDRWVWGSSLKGKKTVWRDATRPDALFLSTAVQFNSPQLKIPATWFGTHLKMFSGNTPIGTTYSDHYIETDKQRILQHLRKADPGLVDVRLDDETMQSLSLKLNFGAVGAPEQSVNEQKVKVLRFIHESPVTHKQAQFNQFDESAGTNRFYELLGVILNALDAGLTMFVDEIDTSLHPLIVRYIVQLFHNPEFNKKGAQLFITTHDVSQLSLENLRRDQIFLLEKQLSLESKLYPLTEYAPRKGEALLKGYLAGRYGAIPLID